MESNGNVLVIGGGISGIQASLDLADLAVREALRAALAVRLSEEADRGSGTATSRRSRFVGVLIGRTP